jgi:hypothetical protein
MDISAFPKDVRDALAPFDSDGSGAIGFEELAAAGKMYKDSLNAAKRTRTVAIVMGVTRRTVQLWLSGSSPVPTAVDIILHAIFEGLLSIEWVEERLVQSLKIA